MKRRPTRLNLHTITAAMPYSINGSGSQTWDRSWVPWLEHNSFIIQSCFAYLRSGWKCVKWGFFASTHPHERMYLHCISPPQAFRNPGPLWRGYKKKKKIRLCSSAAGPLWLTAERQPATSYCACVIPCCAAKGGFHPPCEVCWCHSVTQCTDAISLLQQSSSEKKLQSHPQALPHPGLKMYIFLKIICNLLISLNLFPFYSTILGGGGCRYPPKLK